MKKTLQRVILLALLIAIVSAGFWPWQKDGENLPKRKKGGDVAKGE